MIVTFPNALRCVSGCVETLPSLEGIPSADEATEPGANPNFVTAAVAEATDTVGVGVDNSDSHVRTRAASCAHMCGVMYAHI